MKQYKPLLSSAPANSILNAQQFHYTNSASTDIRKTFANFRRGVLIGLTILMVIWLVIG